MERIAQCLSPVHIGTGMDIDPFDYIVDGPRYIRIDLDAVIEQMTPEQADALASWLNERADRIVEASGGQRDDIRREMQLLNFPGADAALKEALRKDAALRRYCGDRGFGRNLQVREQIKDADETPCIPGSSLKGALRTALAFVALEEMGPDERQTVGRRLEQKVQQVEAAEARGWQWGLRRLQESIGQEIEQAVFRCGKKQRDGRVSYGDIHYDLMRAVSISDTYNAQAELIVPQIYTFVEQRNKDGRTRLDSQAPLIAEAHAPGNTFRLRLQVNGALLRAASQNRSNNEWIDFDRRVQRAFGPEVARLLPNASGEQIEQAVIARIEAAARRFAQAVVAAEQGWTDAHGHGSTDALKDFYNRLGGLIGEGQVPLRLGWGSHFMATTLLLVLKEDASWRPLLERCFRAFKLGLPPRKGPSKRPDAIDLDDFPRSRRLVASGKRPIAPLGWIALVPTGEALPGALVEKERLLARTQAGEPRRASRSQGREPRSTPRPERPLQPIKIPKLAPKPPPRKGPQPGDRVNVEIVANDNAQVVVKVLDNQGEEVRFRQSYYPGRPGTRKKMKVRKVDAQGRITQVAP